MKGKLKDLACNVELFEFYQNAIKYAKPKNPYEIKEMTLQKWGVIKETQNQLSKPNYDIEQIFCDYTGKRKEDLPELDANAFFSQCIWILDEIKKLSENEAKLLSSELTAMEEQAGYGDLQKFGYFATLDALANGQVWRYDEVLNQPYDRVLAKLMLQKLKNEISEKYNKLINNKN